MSIADDEDKQFVREFNSEATLKVENLSKVYVSSSTQITMQPI